MIKVINNKDKYQCIASNGKFEIIADATEDKGGKNKGFRPHELLEAAFATCLNMSIRMRADKLGINISKVLINIEIDRSIPEDAVFIYKIELDGNLSDDEKQKLYETVKLCPVHNTLSRKIKFISHFD